MPQNMASGLGLHGLPVPHKKDARLQWVKKVNVACFKLVYFFMLEVLVFIFCVYTIAHRVARHRGYKTFHAQLN